MENIELQIMSNYFEYHNLKARLRELVKKQYPNHSSVTIPNRERLRKLNDPEEQEKKRQLEEEIQANMAAIENTKRILSMYGLELTFEGRVDREKSKTEALKVIDALNQPIGTEI